MQVRAYTDMHRYISLTSNGTKICTIWEAQLMSDETDSHYSRRTTSTIQSSCHNESQMKKPLRHTHIHACEPTSMYTHTSDQTESNPLHHEIAYSLVCHGHRGNGCGQGAPAHRATSGVHHAQQKHIIDTSHLEKTTDANKNAYTPHTHTHLFVHPHSPKHRLIQTHMTPRRLKANQSVTEHRAYLGGSKLYCMV